MENKDIKEWMNIEIPFLEGAQRSFSSLFKLVEYDKVKNAVKASIF